MSENILISIPFFLNLLGVIYFTISEFVLQILLFLQNLPCEMTALHLKIVFD